MKKFVLLLLSLLILAVPVTALAVPSPLIKVSSNARLLEDGTVQIVSYKAYIKVESDINYTTATVIMKNTSEEDRASFMVGLPSIINQGAVRLNNIEVITDGIQQRLVKRSDRTKINETELTDIPSHWYTWSVKLEPGEYKIVDITYSTDNQKADDGTRSVFIPLEFIKAWYDTPQRIEITVDLGDGAPYLFEPNPSVLPHDYDKKGRLNWMYTNTVAPGYIQVYFRSIEQLAGEVVKTKAPGDRSINNIVESFTRKSYSLTIDQIRQYLETQSETTLKNELLYIMALCHQELLQTNEAIELFNQLEDQPMFGELEGTFKNRVIYDKYNYMQDKLADNAALYEYLDSSKNYIMGNAMFMMWMEEELIRLEPPSTPEPVPTPTSEEIPSPNETEGKESPNELVKTVTIAGYEISVEFLFLGILAIVILITAFIRRRRKTKNRGYLFR